MFDVSHMGEVETSGPDAEAFLQRVLSNDVTKIAERGAQYSVLCREDGGVLDDLFTYRLDGGRFLTVTNASNHEKDFAWFAEHADGFDVRGRGPARGAGRCWPSRAPTHAPRWPAWRTASCPPRMRTADLTRGGGRAAWSAGPATRARTASSCWSRPTAPATVWDALLAAGVTPAGLGARDTLRLEVCFHLYGNDLSEDRNPIEAGLGWCCKLETGFIGADALRGFEPRADDRAVRLHRTRASRARATPSAASTGRAWSRAARCRPASRSASEWPTCRSATKAPGTPIEVDVRGKLRPAEVREKPLYKKES